MMISYLDYPTEMSKRFYLPIILEENCPKCDHSVIRNLLEWPLNHPRLNKQESLWLYCENCHHEWEWHFKLTVNLKPIGE